MLSFEVSVPGVMNLSFYIYFKSKCFALNYEEVGKIQTLKIFSFHKITEKHKSTLKSHVWGLTHDF